MRTHFLRGMAAALLLFVLLLCLPVRASAYTDPGSASLLIQVFLVAVAGAAYRFRSFLRRLIHKD